MSDQSFISSSHTSAHESAAGTATAVDKDESSRRHDPSIGSTGTPIKEVPGRGAASVVPQSQDPGDHAHHGMLASAKSAIHDATETIKHFLPGSSPESKSRQTEGKSDKPSGRVVHKPPESGKQPILESSADETKPEDSPLPSKEIPGGSKIGVGSLPGHLSEVSVAKLPEERRQENLPSHETDHEQLGKTGGVGPLPGGPNESGVALLPEERAHPVEESRLQTEDVKDVPSKSVTGDDSLPGTHSTTSVKKLAEELRQEVHPSPRIDKEQPQKAENAGPLSGDQSESGVSALEVEHDVRDETSDKPENVESDKSQSQTGAVPTSFDQPVRQGGQHEELTAVPPGLVLTDFSSDRGAQGQRVLPTATNKPIQEAKEEDEGRVQRSKETAQDPRNPITEARRTKSGDGESASKQTAQDISDSHGPSPCANSVSEHEPTSTTPMAASRKHRASTGSTPTHKVGLMDKMKGEAMVISGKLGKNEKKVEEGRNLMGK